MFKAVIFDMDGIVIDSEHLWEKTERMLLHRKGFEYNADYRNIILGLNQNDSARLLKKRFNIRDSIDEIISERLDLLLGLYKNELELNPGITELLDMIKHKEACSALATSSPEKVVSYVLEKFGLENYFDSVLSGDSVAKGKPYPDIYLLTACELGVKTGDCIVIEDSINGVRSAKNAGMYCIAVPDSRIDLSDLQIADEIEDTIESLLENSTLRNLVS